jgi:hypothetical protein
MTAAVEGGEWSAACSCRTLPPGKNRYPFYRMLVGPQGRSGWAENLAPPGFDPRTVQFLVSRYTDLATGPINKSSAHFYLLFIYDRFDITLSSITVVLEWPLSCNYQAKTVRNVAFSYRLHTTENRVHSQSFPCENYCEEMVLCQVYLRVLRFYCTILIPAILHNSYFIHLLPMPHNLNN